MKSLVRIAAFLAASSAISAAAATQMIVAPASFAKSTPVQPAGVKSVAQPVQFNMAELRALKPGGMVVLEAFHRDATKVGPIGGGVVFDSNELLQLFAPLRVIRYEDTTAVADFGQQPLRVVRLAAVRP